MPFKPVDEKTVGLYSENALIQAAYVISEKGALIVNQLIEYSVYPKSDDHVKPLYIAEENKLQELCKEHLTIAALSESDVLVRRLRLKLVRDKDIEEAFLFQAEPQLPYPIDTAILDKIIVEKGEGSSLIVFLATKKDYVQKLLNFWKEHTIDPEMVSAEPIALNALLNAASTTPQALQHVVHVGQFATLSLLIKEGKLLASHSIQMGWDALYAGQALDKNSLMHFTEDLDLLNIDAFPNMKKALDELLQMILWNYLSLIKETKVKENPALYVLGEGANILHLSSLISTTLGIKRESLSDFSGTCKENKLNRFAIPIGLALSAQPNDNLSQALSVNFRRQEHAYSTPWRRFKKPLMIYGALALGVACSLYFFGAAYLQNKEDELKSQFLTLLSFTQKPYDVFETQYEQKFPYEKKSDGIIQASELDATDISQRIDFLESGIKSMPDSFPLLPNIPRVSDVLVWISTHPKLICKDNSVPLDCLPFTIDIFNYSLVKRPEINKKSEKYQVKIDLEFSTSSPRLAREFHDALITPNDFVDPKGEIKWTATKGKYRTSFYLKDKTTYP